MKIAILDKHVLFAESLQQLLIKTSDMVDANIYQSIENLIEDAYDKFFDIMIIDQKFLGKDENALINYLRNRYPSEMAIVILAENNDRDISKKINMTKVNAVINKNTPVNEFIDLINDIKERDSFLMAKGDW